MAKTKGNATGSGEVPEPAEDQATNEGVKPQGVGVYPPSPSDQAGEKTDNVPPAKKLPPDPPADQGASELARVTAERDALAAVVRNLGGNPDEVCRTATAGLAQTEQKNKGPVKKATVTQKGGQPVTVEFPADAQNKTTAAIEAYKAHTGIWSLPEQPEVTHHE